MLIASVGTPVSLASFADALPATTVISIGHRGSLEASHHRVIAIDRTGRPARLIDRGAGVSGRYGLAQQAAQ